MKPDRHNKQEIKLEKTGKKDKDSRRRKNVECKCKCRKMPEKQKTPNPDRTSADTRSQSVHSSPADASRLVHLTGRPQCAPATLCVTQSGQRHQVPTRDGPLFNLYTAHRDTETCHLQTFSDDPAVIVFCNTELI